MTGTIAVYGLLFIGILGVRINAGITCDDGVGGSVDCKFACCGYTCCPEIHNQGFDIGTIIGISMGILFVKALIWGCCIYAIRRRHRNRLMVGATRPTSVSTTTAFTNPAHIGYNQLKDNIPMSPPPYTGSGAQAAPPAYET